MTDDPDAPVMIISADGHAVGRMRDYRPYIDPDWREEFDRFCDYFDQVGSYSHEPTNLLTRLDKEDVEWWDEHMLASGELDAVWNGELRLKQMDKDGITAEVVIPDFGQPFELGTPLHLAKEGLPKRTPEQVAVGNRAYNRWLIDFCSIAPERYAPMAAVSFGDVDQAITEIRRAHTDGAKGIMLPFFPEGSPAFDPRYDPIWRTLSELGLPANTHISISGASDRPIQSHAPVPHPGVLTPIFGKESFFNCHQVLPHLIWGGVLEKHPDLQVVITEQGTDWLIFMLASADYTYEGSYLRRDLREVIKLKPSEYFRRQCWTGSSLLSTAEVAARHEIGVERFTFGVDYPHHEGTWWGGNGTRDYLRATFGEVQVPLDETRRMLGGNAAKLWGFDVDKLATIATRIGPTPSEILTPPTEDLFPRGDVHKPLGVGVG